MAYATEDALEETLIADPAPDHRLAARRLSGGRRRVHGALLQHPRSHRLGGRRRSRHAVSDHRRQDQRLRRRAAAGGFLSPRCAPARRAATDRRTRQSEPLRELVSGLQRLGPHHSVPLGDGESRAGGEPSLRAVRRLDRRRQRLSRHQGVPAHAATASGRGGAGLRQHPPGRGPTEWRTGRLVAGSSTCCAEASRPRWREGR